ncbi:MAG: hypothetical protein E4H09_01160 [Spirochaetales bacterium]|nr:MAG: hypothetical protein E4H09_01160 [Spirochaetales bacterium]
MTDYLAGTWELRLSRAVVRYAADAPRVVYPRTSRNAVVGTVVIHPDHQVNWYATAGNGSPQVAGEPGEVPSLTWSVVQRPDGRNVLIVSDAGSVGSSWSCWVIDKDTMVLITPPDRIVYPNSLLQNSYLAHRLGPVGE